MRERSMPSLHGEAVQLLSYCVISCFVTLPSGRVGPKGRRGGAPRRTLSIGFAGEPWANAQRLICSVAELARVWRIA